MLDCVSATSSRGQQFIMTKLDSFMFHLRLYFFFLLLKSKIEARVCSWLLLLQFWKVKGHFTSSQIPQLWSHPVTQSKHLLIKGRALREQHMGQGFPHGALLLRSISRLQPLFSFVHCVNLYIADNCGQQPCYYSNRAVATRECLLGMCAAGPVSQGWWHLVLSQLKLGFWKQVVCSFVWQEFLPDPLKR